MGCLLLYVRVCVTYSNVLCRLPDKFPEGSRVFVIDPMLATGTNLHLTAINIMSYTSSITIKLSGIFPLIPAFKMKKIIDFCILSEDNITIILVAVQHILLYCVVDSVTRLLLIFLLKISGGTIVAALDFLKERGIDNKQIKVVNNLEESFLFQSNLYFGSSLECLCCVKDFSLLDM